MSKFTSCLTIAIASFTFPLAASAGLFGPDIYDECILENMKGVTSDSAARLVAASCRTKFDKKEPKTVRGVCKVYWDGFKFLIGDKPSDKYSTYSMENDGIEMLEMSLPKQLADRLKFEKEMHPNKGNFGKFFESNYSQIARVCRFE